MTVTERFWSKVVEGPDGCWLWTAKLNESGYGRFWDGQRVQRAHRVAYQWLVGEIPDGLTLDHLCHNEAAAAGRCSCDARCLHRSCVNPHHLEPATNADNSLRGQSPLALYARKTHCPLDHPYAGDNLYVWNGKRYCRMCRDRLRKESRVRRYPDGLPTPTPARQEPRR